MNFKELATTRTAIRVEEEDIDLFIDLATENGFMNLFGEPLEPWDITEGNCRTHGYNSRCLNKRLSIGSFRYYASNGFPVCDFKEFDEYVAINPTQLDSINSDDLMSILG